MKPYQILFHSGLFLGILALAPNNLAAQTTDPTQVSAAERLDQVADLLGQLQQSGILNPPASTPDSAPATLGARPQTQRTATGNPFQPRHSSDASPPSKRSQAIDVANQLLNRTLKGESQVPSVEIGEETIRIDLGGRSFEVPRRVSQPRSTPASAGSTNVGELLKSLGQSSLDRALMYQQLGYAISDFSKRDYGQARARLDAYRDQLADDGVIAQTYALTLFQQGEFAQAAAAAHDGLRSAKPFDWETLRGMYANPADYTARYEQLQKLAMQEPDRVEYRFLLGYHHLMLGHKQHAARELEAVAGTLSDDPVVRRLSALTRTVSSQPPAPLPR